MRNNEDRIGINKQLQDVTPPNVLQANNQTLNLNFVVPTEFVELPSKGRFYDPSHPLHGKETIEIKQMTAKEEDILTSRSLLKKGVALDKLLESIILDKSINPDTLTIEDRNAIIVSTRISGYGPQYTTSVICPSCEQKTRYTFDLSNKINSIETEEFEQDPETVIDENGNFSFVLPSTKWNVVCRALNGRDEKTISNLSEAKKKSSNDSFLIDQLLLMVVSIQEVTDRQVLQNALNAIPASDSRFLRKMYRKAVKPFEMKQSFYCSNCSHEADLEVPLSADFFWFK